MIRHVLLLGAAFGVAACSGQPEGGPAVTARPEAAPPSNVPVSMEATIVNGANTLTVKPGYVFACDGRDRATSTVGWSSSDPAVKGVVIKVQAPDGGEQKVFAEGGSSGAAETGNWVTAGVKFFMVDLASGKELATHAVTAHSCQ